jgi:hypothetical protein
VVDLLVSVYYRSLEGSKSLPVRTSHSYSDRKDDAQMLAAMCAKICQMFESNPYR